MSTLAEVILRDTRANQPAAGSTPAGTLYYVTDESVLERCTGAAWESYSAAAGLSNPMTTAEDIIVGGASGTPARLAVGTEGQVLSVSSGSVAWAAASGGSGLSTGTSFPGTPSTGDRYRRSDIDYLVFFYDGTQWVTEQIYSLTAFIVNQSAAQTNPIGVPQALNGNATGVRIESLNATAYVASTNNGSNYWTFNASTSADGGAISWTARATVNTSAKTANTYNAYEDYDGSTVVSLPVGVFGWEALKTGSPGNVYANVVLSYRLVAA